MKTAVLVFGKLRTFETVVKTWNLKNHEDFDFYFSTWGENMSDNPNQAFEITEKDTRDIILSKIPSATIKVFDETNDVFSNLRNSHKMLHHWLELLTLVKQSGTHYDKIILTRTDSIFYIQNLNGIYEYDKDVIYSSGDIYTNDENISEVNDTFFIGDFSIMDYFISNIDYTKVTCPHRYLGTLLVNQLKVKVKPIGDVLTTRIVRTGMLDLYETLDDIPMYVDDIDYVPEFNREYFIRQHRILAGRIEPDYCNILVIGETCDDVFIYGDVSRLNPEAPVPIIIPTKTITNKGMSANVINNIRSLGMNNISHITNHTPIKKTRYVDDSYNYILLRIDDCDSVDRIDMKSIDRLPYIDYVVISDYNKGFLSKSDIKNICDYFKNSFIFIDTKKKLGDWASGVSYIKINNSEYERSKDYIENNPNIKSKTIITKGKYGCDFNGENFPTDEVLIKDVVGAGDTFLSGLVYSFIRTGDINKSINFANKCSTQVVQKRGVGIVKKEELDV